MKDQTLHDQIIERAMKDPAFHQALLQDPRAALAHAFNVHVPEQMTIRVVAEAPNTLTLDFPVAPPAVQELSDADLQNATGGYGYGYGYGYSRYGYGRRW